MQIKIFTIPIMGGEKLLEEMNAFLRSKKILQVEQHLVQEAGGSCWCYSIRYIEGEKGKYKFGKTSKKIDYREVLDEHAYACFSKMREIRKQIAEREGVPAYAVFTNAELAELAKIEKLTLSKMKTVKGIGAQKVEKYGAHFTIETKANEKSE